MDIKVAEVKRSWMGRGEAKSFNKAWLRRRLHAAIVRDHVAPGMYDLFAGVTFVLKVGGLGALSASRAAAADASRAAWHPRPSCVKVVRSTLDAQL